MELAVEGLAYGGHGVGRIDDFVVFVRRAVPGDRVRARVVNRKRSYAEAVLLEILEPSGLRVPPACGHVADCGGCEWQTLDYGAQLDFKQRQVVESLEHIGGLTGYELEPIRGM
ncbi:MAG TPA: TRAM domain-containing protein, partial [Thermoleophilia bacterium]|nr:TRAM domain-containing protein [Thermoleophilia bacterium]